MKPMKTFISALIVIVGAMSASANLVVNGDFSLPVTTQGENGWTFANLVGYSGWQATGGNPGGTFVLNFYGTNNPGPPTVAQTISGLTVGQIYTISGDYAMGNQAITNTDFGVAIDGNQWYYSIPTVPGQWDSFSETFTASSSTVDLVLTGEHAHDSDPRVDNISLVGSVPEPASLLGMAFGLGILATRRRKK